MNKKTIISLSKIVFLSLVIYFLSFYNSSKNGYYQNEQNKIKLYTEEQIKKFEEDIKNNQEIDINDYFNYENKVEKKGKKIGLQISQGIEKYTKYGFEKAFKLLNNFIDN